MSQSPTEPGRPSQRCQACSNFPEDEIGIAAKRALVGLISYKIAGVGRLAHRRVRRANVAAVFSSFKAVTNAAGLGLTEVPLSCPRSKPWLSGLPGLIDRSSLWKWEHVASVGDFLFNGISQIGGKRDN